MAMLLNYLEKFVRELSVSVHQHAGVVLCGDFNALPDSDVMKLIEQGEVTPEHTSSPDRLLCDTSLETLCTWFRILGEGHVEAIPC